MNAITKPPGGGADNWIGSSDCFCCLSGKKLECVQNILGSSEKCRDYLKNFPRLGEWSITVHVNNILSETDQSHLYHTNPGRLRQGRLCFCRVFDSFVLFFLHLLYNCTAKEK